MKLTLRAGVPLLLSCAVAGTIGAWWYRGIVTKRVFENVVLGAPQASILRDLGAPDRTEGCAKNLYWGNSRYLGENDGRCVTTWRYDHLLTSYAISFDSGGSVVAKYTYFSE
jgi:hypothetical protein